MRTKSYVLLVMTSLIIGGCAQGIKNEKTSSLKTLKIKDPYPKPNTVEMKGGMWSAAPALDGSSCQFRHIRLRLAFFPLAPGKIRHKPRLELLKAGKTVF